MTLSVDLHSLSPLRSKKRMAHWESEREAFYEALDPFLGYYSMSHPVGIVFEDERLRASYEQYVAEMHDLRFRSRIYNALDTPGPRRSSIAGMASSQDWMTMIGLLDTSRLSGQERSVT